MDGRTRLAAMVLTGGGTAEILLAGELDLDAGPDLERTVAEVLCDLAVHRIEIDTALVRFCDAGGLGALLAARQLAAARGVPLHLVQVRPRLGKVLDAAGLHSVLVRRPPD